MSKDAEPSRKPAPDWERIEVEYRAGVRSLREIAAEHGISHGAINKRAMRIGLINRYGLEAVEALENDNSTHKWTRDELVAIRRHYMAKLKETQKA